ncbi:hypothetical protein [Bartonella sp. LJL80]
MSWRLLAIVFVVVGISSLTAQSQDRKPLGAWDFAVTSLHYSNDGVRPITQTSRICLQKSADEAAVFFDFEPRIGRCKLKEYRITDDSLLVWANCDEGADIGGHYQFEMYAVSPGRLEGDLDYGSSSDDTRYGIQAQSSVVATYVGQCGE